MPKKRFIKPFKKNSSEYQLKLMQYKIAENFKLRVTKSFENYRRGDEISKTHEIIKILSDTNHINVVKVTR